MIAQWLLNYTEGLASFTKVFTIILATMHCIAQVARYQYFVDANGRNPLKLLWYGHCTLRRLVYGAIGK